MMLYTSCIKHQEKQRVRYCVSSISRTQTRPFPPGSWATSEIGTYHPSVLLKLYIYGYLNRVQSSRRLEREAGRNVEVMWLLGRLAPDHKTIADFRKDNGLALRKVCARFVELCREMGLLATASVAISLMKPMLVTAIGFSRLPKT